MMTSVCRDEWIYLVLVETVFSIDLQCEPVSSVSQEHCHLQSIYMSEMYVVNFFFFVK